MTPDTYFFVELIVDKKHQNYGPYLDLESATVVMIDLMPALARIKAKKEWYSYESRLHEKIMDRETEWITLHTHIIENKCYKKGQLK